VESLHRNKENGASIWTEGLWCREKETGKKHIQALLKPFKTSVL